MEPPPDRYVLLERPEWRTWQQGVAKTLCRTPGAHEPGREVREFPCPDCVSLISHVAETARTA